MNKTLLLILIFIFTTIICSANNSIMNHYLWQRAHQEIKSEDYNKAILTYNELSKHIDSTYKAINSEQVEDLRYIYSTDKLELENKEKRNQLFRYTFKSLFYLLIILICFYSYLTYQKHKLIRLQEKLNSAKIAAENSIKNKSLFLSNMSHEIRTPLNALSGFSSVLTEQGIDEITRQQCNDIIQQNSKLLLDLINDIVDISCLDTNFMNFNIKKCNVVALCQNVVNTLEGIKQTQANIIFNSTQATLTLETDTVRLQQVLINILVNATKFTKQGSITLRLDKHDEHMAHFSITDTGCGIPLNKQKKIFARFEKINEKDQGTGIGLSICSIIIKRMGGDIWIDPEYTDGTRFIFTHPIKQSKLS